jgi:hypothetical protein
MRNAKMEMTWKGAMAALLLTLLAVPVAAGTAAGDGAKAKPVTKSDKSAAASCSTPAAKAATQKRFDEIQTTRMSDDPATVRLVHAALLSPCMESKKYLLVRIGIVVVCNAQMQADARTFYQKGNRDPLLVQSCPQLLP